MASRTYMCGNDKRKKKRKEEQLIQTLKGSLNKYFATTSQPSEDEPADVVDRDEQEDGNLLDHEPVDVVDRDEQEEGNLLANEPVDVVDRDEQEEANNEQGEPLDIYDPMNWKSIDQKLIDTLVEKGPIRVEMKESEYPRDDSDVLFVVNIVSKTLQSEDIHIDIAIDQLKGLINHFRDYREHGFNDALIEAKELARQMDVEPVFRQKRQIRRKRHFDEGSSEDVSFCPQESFRVECFMFIVDKALASFHERFEQFRVYEANFGFLFDLKKCTNDESLKSSCEHLSNILRGHDGQVDIDGDDLFMELRVLKHMLPSNVKGPIQVLNHLKQTNGCFPNTEIAYRILLTIPVTVASGERSFSKLKLLKNYLRSTMSQERLNGLAMISIEKNIVGTIDYSTIITDFASKCARREIFK